MVTCWGKFVVSWYVAPKKQKINLAERVEYNSVLVQ